MKVFSSLIWSVLYLGTLYAGVHGSGFATGLIEVWVWFIVICCGITFASVEAQNRLVATWKEEKQSELTWIWSICLDVIVLVTLFHYEWYFTGIVFAVGIWAALNLRFSYQNGTLGDARG